MSATVAVDVQIACDVASMPGKRDLESWIADVVGETAFERDCEISVRIVDEVEGRALNKQYRGIDKATNVLSFPAGFEMFDQADGNIPYSLGDIVICAPVVEREAADQQKSPGAHWAHLLVHGTLHLLGHDHEDPTEAAAMEALEIRILEKRGIEDPYNVPQM